MPLRQTTIPCFNALLNRNNKKESAVASSKARREALIKAHREAHVEACEGLASAEKQLTQVCHQLTELSQILKSKEFAIANLNDVRVPPIDPPTTPIHSNPAIRPPSLRSSDFKTKIFKNQHDAIAYHKQTWITQTRLNKRTSSVAQKKFLTKGLNPTRAELYKKMDTAMRPDDNAVKLMPIRKKSVLNNTSPTWCLYWRHSQQPPRRIHNIVLEVTEI